MKTNFSILILIILANLTCSKKNIDKPTIKKERPTFECSSIPSQDFITTGWNYLVNNKLYTSPYFNPNNGFEFVFMNHNNSNSYSRIYTYNLITKKKKLVYEGQTHTHLEWTSNNWIIFNSEYLKKIRPNGTHLQNITKINYNFTTKNNNFLYEKKGSTPSNSIYYFTDFYNYIYDSIDISISGCKFEWGLNDKVIFANNDFIVYDLSTKEIKRFCQNYNLANISSPKWINDNEFVWANETNIFKTNIHTNIIDTIVSHCNGFKYQEIDYSPQLDKLICHRVTQKVIDDNLIKIDIYIVMMNTDGSEKEIIDIDNEFKRK